MSLMYFSAMLRLRGKCCLVVGAGTVAERKTKKLLEAEASVKVVSPEATETIRRWAQTGKIKWEERAFQARDPIGATLVVAATNDASVNLSVYEAVRPEQWINVVDRPDLSDFIFPAVFSRGELQISVSTGGNYPGLAKKLKEKLADEIGPEYEHYLAFLKEIRQRARESRLDGPEASELLLHFLDDRYVQLSREEKLEKHKQAAFQRIAEMKNKSN